MDNPREVRELFVPIGSIRVNVKKRRKLSSAKINRYAACFEAGDNFPPVCVSDCGDFYTIRDGRHRFVAQLRNGYSYIAVSVR
jgi:hypothetical protein